MSEGKFEKSIWESLSPETQEVCESIGGVPIGFNTFHEIYEDVAEKTLKELKEKGLIEEMTLQEELERKTKDFNEEEIHQKLIKIEFKGISKEEKEASDAFRRLRETNEEDLNSKRLCLKPEFGKFVDTLE